MKLIINIPDEAYELLKSKSELDNIAESIIANGIPYEERPQGEWVCDYTYLDCKCSICNSYALERGDYPELSKYCPQCGALMTSIKMRGVDNDT